MALDQLLGSLQGFGLVSSKDRHHRDAFGQVSDHVEEQWNVSQLMVGLPRMFLS